MNEPVDVVIGEGFPPLYAPRPPSVYIYVGTICVECIQKLLHTAKCTIFLFLTHDEAV